MDYLSGTVLYQNKKCCDEAKSSIVEVNETYLRGLSSRNDFNDQSGNDVKDAVYKSRTITPDGTNEPYVIKSKCYHYKALLQRVRTLLDEIKAIKNNEATGMCEFCNRYNSTGKCKRCEMLSNKYGIRSTVEKETRQQRFKIWLFKVKQFLYRILESEVCKYKLYHGESAESEELKRLLQELKPFLDIREPYRGQFPSIDSLDNLTEIKDILEEVLLKLKIQNMHANISADEASHSISSADADFKTTGQDFLGKSLAIKLPPFPVNKVKVPAHSDAAHDSNYLVRDAIVPNTDRSPCPSTCKYFDGKQEKAQLDEAKNKNLNDIQAFDDKIRNSRLSTKRNSGIDKTGAVKKSISQDQKDSLIKDRESKADTKADSKGTKESIPKKDTNEKTQNKKDKATKEKELKTDTKADSKGAKEPIPKKDTYEKTQIQKDKTTKDKEIKADSQGTKEMKPKKTNEKPKHNPEDEMMAMLLKSTNKKEENKQKTELKNTEKPMQLPKIEELPEVVRKPKKDVEKMTSESFIQCGLVNEKTTKMIKGTDIIPFAAHGDSETGSIEPMLFKIKTEITNKEQKPNSSLSTSEAATPTKKKTEVDQKFGKSVVQYALSNRDYIEKGWTLLPTTKIMRRMNIYKMLPASPKFDWFKRHKSRRELFYYSGEKLAEIEEDGNGKWYYRNGNLALDYYDSQETNSGYRYVIYSSGEKDVGGRNLPVTVLASFDYLGNGVVYDHNGYERMKYNQSEGVVIDDKIGPPGRWKWHTLNEPPVLEPVFIDNYIKNDDCIQNLLKSRKDDEKSNDGSKYKKEPNLDMLAIELENFVKEKANKLLQEFKPFHIRMKACKINKQFSLKVLDQSNIYLLFRDGQTSMKLNLGMVLLSDEIVDTYTAEVTQVSTPYDRHPPKSQSIANIQNVLENARKFGVARKLRC